MPVLVHLGAEALNLLKDLPAERFRSFRYDDLLKRDKVNLDIFWL